MSAEGELEKYFPVHSSRLDNSFFHEMQCRITLLVPLSWEGMSPSAGYLSSSILHISVQSLLQYITNVRMQRHK